MKFQAPVGVTGLSCAGAEIAIEADGGFEAPEFQQAALLAHGCWICTAPVSSNAASKNCGEARARPSRVRSEKGL